MEIFTNTNYDFLKWRFHVIAGTVLFILVGVGILLARGVNLGIDFAGGANVILKFREEVPIDQLRAIISDASIQQYGKVDERSVLLRLPQQKQEGDYAGEVVTKLHQSLNPDAGGKLDLNFQGSDAIAEFLKSKDPDRLGSGVEASSRYQTMAQSIIDKRSESGIFSQFSQVSSAPGVSSATSSLLAKDSILGQFNLLSQETVGPQVGAELRRKALWAIVLSTLAMGLYIAVRFDLKFGVGAIFCLVHDVLLSLAFLAMINGEFEIITVAAFLMIIGYSINDTVVVYDRVRENLNKQRTREDFATLLNRTLNQTLSRTILTGGCVFLILLTLIFFGGQVIHEFALLLFMGVVAGTVSTVTVVPAIVLAWHKRFN